MCVYYSHNVEETYRIGERLGSKLRSGDVVAYFGGMGMGKTTFTHGLATGLGINEKDVSSPTFALVHEYRGKENTLYHFDMYRIESWDDLYSTGFLIISTTAVYLPLSGARISKTHCPITA